MFVAATLALSASASAEPEWISFDGSDPGTRAVVVATTESTEDRTIVECRIPGAWFEPRLGNDGITYTHIRVPGLGFLNTLGHPELPAARIALAVPDPGAAVTVGDVDVETQHVFDDIDVWPHVFPAADGGKTGPFQRDDDVYGSTVDYPAVSGSTGLSVRAVMGSIDGVECVIHPVVWNPEARRLVVRSSTRFAIDHVGTPATRDPITRDRAVAAASQFANWDVMRAFWPTNITTYTADYLIVHAPGFDDELAPFVAHLKTRGFRVTLLSTLDTGDTCESIRAAIAAWHAASPTNWDHFALLVGDIEDIPHCRVGPTDDYVEFYDTDDLYGGNSLQEHTFVGRLSVDDGQDLTHQLSKIMDYTNDTVLGWNRNRVLLAADMLGHETSHEGVRTEPYATSPEFVPLYGIDGWTNADASAAIDGGVGILAYRGDALFDGWRMWNTLGESYLDSDVAALANGARTPVVWTVSRDANDLDPEDGFGESWMKAEAGAVAHYGANGRTHFGANNLLTQDLADAVFDDQLPTLGHVMAAAEWAMQLASYEENAWPYLLLGDPSMPIRRDDESFEAIVPTHFELCEIPCVLEITALDALGNPVPGALVSVWKPAGGARADAHDEVFANHYTDAAGTVALTVQPTTPGLVAYSVRDQRGRVAVGEIPVTDDPVAVPDPAAEVVSLTATPTVFSSSTTISFGVAIAHTERVHVLDAAGRLVAELRASVGQGSVRWDGRDRHGRRVAPGRYFVRVAGTDVTSRVAVVR